MYRYCKEINGRIRRTRMLYSQMTEKQLESILEQLRAEYDDIKEKGMSLDLSR